MSGDEREAFFDALSGLEEGERWQGPVVFRDMARLCCEATGHTQRHDRPCFFLDNVMSRGECAALHRAMVEATEGGS